MYTKDVEWPFRATNIIFPLYDRSIEGDSLCKLCGRLLVSAGGSLASAASTPHLGAFEAGGTLPD